MSAVRSPPGPLSAGLPVPSDGHPTPPPLGSAVPSGPTLRGNLLRDFGHDLPISGGWGASRTDPIAVAASDAEAVALVEARVLDDLSRVRGVY